jgi:hypothetical protein
MTLCEKLVAHKGGLVCLKTELFWYDGGGWDSTPGRVCLLMDSAAAGDAPATWIDAFSDAATTATATLLLIDGRPHWVLVGADDLELL